MKKSIKSNNMDFKSQKDKLISFNDLRSYSRHWIKEFIEAYKNEICLWQTKHPDYNNHILRNLAYDKLVEKLKEVESNPDRTMVVRKINSLRSAFRREYRKKCVRSDYEPRLWYYNALAFISDQQNCSNKRGSGGSGSDKDRSHEKEKKRLFSEKFDDDDDDEIEDEHENDNGQQQQPPEDNEEITMHPYEEECEGNDDININIKEEQSTRMINVSSNVDDDDEQMITIEHHHNDGGGKMIEIHHPQERQETQIVTLQSNQREHETQQAVNSITSHSQHQQPVPVHTIQIQTARGDSYETTGHNDKDHQVKVMNLFKSSDCIPLLNTSMVKHDDEYDAIGINVASKLRSMSHHQRIVAEKLISDVLFSGQLESLTVSSKLIV